MREFFIQTVNAIGLLRIVVPEGLVVSTIGNDGVISISGKPVPKEGRLVLILEVVGACGNPLPIIIDFNFE
jgi:hypothetical protein